LPISQGLKAGLAAGVVYGAMIGLLHLGTLEACSSAQISIIAQKLLQENGPTNVTASTMFYSTDVLYFPMIYAIWALIYGVVYGVVYAALYIWLPGTDSKRKGMTLGIPVFVIGIVAGPAYPNYVCSPSYLPLIAIGLGLPASFVFGYVLGLFYDSFGRLAQEQRMEREKLKSSGSADLRLFWRSVQLALFRKTTLPSLHELRVNGPISKPNQSPDLSHAL
jgi:MFS family permease